MSKILQQFQLVSHYGDKEIVRENCGYGIYRVEEGAIFHTWIEPKDMQIGDYFHFNNMEKRCGKDVAGIAIAKIVELKKEDETPLAKPLPVKYKAKICKRGEIIQFREVQDFGGFHSELNIPPGIYLVTSAAKETASELTMSGHAITWYAGVCVKITKLSNDGKFKPTKKKYEFYQDGQTYAHSIADPVEVVCKMKENWEIA